MKKKRFPVSAIVANAILCLVCCFCVLPVLLLVISSFTDNDTVFRNGYSFFPEKWSLGAYEYLVTQSETVTRAFPFSSRWSARWRASCLRQCLDTAFPERSSVGAGD